MRFRVKEKTRPVSQMQFPLFLVPLPTHGHRWQVDPASFLHTALCHDFWFFPVQAAQGSIKLIQQTLQQPHLQGPRMNSSKPKGVSLVSASYARPIISTHPRSNTSFGNNRPLWFAAAHMMDTGRAKKLSYLPSTDEPATKSHVKFPSDKSFYNNTC